MVYGQLSFVERGKPNEESNCTITAERRDLLTPLRLLLVEALITKSVVALLWDRWETCGF